MARPGTGAQGWGAGCSRVSACGLGAGPCWRCMACSSPCTRSLSRRAQRSCRRRRSRADAAGAQGGSSLGVGVSGPSTGGRNEAASRPPCAAGPSSRPARGGWGGSSAGGRGRAAAGGTASTAGGPDGAGGSQRAWAWLLASSAVGRCCKAAPPLPCMPAPGSSRACGPPCCTIPLPCMPAPGSSLACGSPCCAAPYSAARRRRLRGSPACRCMRSLRRWVCLARPARQLSLLPSNSLSGCVREHCCSVERAVGRGLVRGGSLMQRLDAPDAAWGGAGAGTRAHSCSHTGIAAADLSG